MGEQHIAGFEAAMNCRVKTLCDFSAAKLEEIRSRHPGKALTDNASELLMDPEIDIVSIASFDNFHCEQIVQALDNGKHVFVEKPLCLFAYEAEKIHEALLRNRGLFLSSNLILRLSPRMRTVRNMIQEGKFGELFYIEADYEYGRLEKITGGWRGSIDFYSVIHGGAIHMVDLVLWMTGQRPVLVRTIGNKICSRNTSYKYQDFALSILTFPSGLIVKVGTNFGCVKPHFHSLRVFGTEGTFENDYGPARFFTSRDSNAEPELITDEYPGVHKGSLLTQFVRSISEGGTPPVSQKDTFDAMSVCLAMQESMDTGIQIEVTYY